MNQTHQNQSAELSKKISPPLLERLKATGAASPVEFNIIVNLDPDRDWDDSLRNLSQAGFTFSSQEKAILVVSGRASSEAIWRIAALTCVRLIEPDAQISAL